MNGPFELRASLAGMAREDCFHVIVPAEYARLSIGQLLDRAFPEDEHEQGEVAASLDLRANPDLPEIFGVFLDAMEEWRQGRCLLTASAGETGDIDLASRVSDYLEILPTPVGDGSVTRSLDVRVEQRYHAVDYAAQSEFWDSKDELLDWLQSLTLLYFLDKHDVELPLESDTDEDRALLRTIANAQREGLLTGSEDGSAVEISEEGLRSISGLLAETESYIDLYDHFKDTVIDTDLELVEFETDEGVDLRVQVYCAEGLDPARTVFLLRLYDGSLDEHLHEWKTRINEEEFFDNVLEPVVNRYDVGDELIELVCDHGSAFLEERQQRLRELEGQNAIRRRVRRSLSRD